MKTVEYIIENSSSESKLKDLIKKQDALLDLYLAEYDDFYSNEYNRENIPHYLIRELENEIEQYSEGGLDLDDEQNIIKIIAHLTILSRI